MDRTVVVSIGNSDNKLTQAEWHEFVQSVDVVLAKCVRRTHFRGFSPGEAPWQNAAWWVEMDERRVLGFHEDLRRLLPKFNQESIAFLWGNGELIKEQK